MHLPSTTCFILLIGFLIYLIQDGRAVFLSAIAPFKSEPYRIKIYNDLLPSWDANQTWLVFTLAGLYGAFPDFFGKLMSTHYSFFLLLMFFFILRGASIEFYMKSSRFKSCWMILLALSSLLILIGHIEICNILLQKAPYSIFIFVLIAVFILAFHLTQSCFFLGPLDFFARFILFLGLLVASSALLNQLDISIWQSPLNLTMLLLRILLMMSFLIPSIFQEPPKFFGALVLYFFFISHLVDLGPKLFDAQSLLQFNQLALRDHASSYFLINLFSMILLPIIAWGLAKMKKVFSNRADELSY